jgi:hypothetical protein
LRKEAEKEKGIHKRQEERKRKSVQTKIRK